MSIATTRISPAEHRTILLLGCSMVALLAVSGAARAQVTTGYTYTVGSAGIPVTSSSTSPTSVDLLPGASDASSNSIFGHDFGTVGAGFGSRSSGSGVYSLSGFTDYKSTVTNTSATTNDYTVTYTIINGDLGVGAAVTAIGSQLAQLTASLTSTSAAGTKTLLDYASSMNFNSTTHVTPIFSESGLVLNAAGATLAADTGDYSWSSYTGTVDVGILAPGASVALEYKVTSAVTGTTPFTTSPPIITPLNLGVVAYGGYGGYGGTTNGGNAVARFGDPFNGTGTGGAFVVTANAVAVPEPASMAVLGAGFAALAFVRRHAARS